MTGGAAATVAMRVLGRDTILHRLAAVIARRSGDLSAMPDLSPQLLVRASLARECVLGDVRGQHTPMAYAAGLLSMLDVVIAQPVAALLDRLALGPLMQQALLDRTGPIGDALDAADAIANGWWADAASRRPIEQMGAMVREAWRTARRDLIALRTT
jgi:c-di-GMP-related signal transduction protein